MIVRRWSEWVVAAYAPDPGNPFGDRLLYVADRRESVAPQAMQRSSDVGSWENERAPTLRAQDRSPT